MLLEDADMERPAWVCRGIAKAQDIRERCLQAEANQTAINAVTGAGEVNRLGHVSLCAIVKGLNR